MGDTDRWDRNSLLRVVRDDIDWIEVSRVVEWHKQTPFGLHKAHYLDLGHVLADAVNVAIELGLNQVEKQRILDLGTGHGAFAHVLKKLGHDVVATERAADASTNWNWSRMSKTEKQLYDEDINRYLETDGRSLYEDLTTLLGVERTIWTVEASAPAPPLGAPFDVIYAGALYFDHPKGRKESWNLAEWRYFVGEVGSSLLTTSGQLILQWTHDRRGLEHILAAFREANARIQGYRVQIGRDDCIRFATAG